MKWKFFFQISESDFEILKQIFLSKEQELKLISNKVDQLTKQLEQLKIIHLNINDDQLENKTQLEKLKQELLVNWKRKLNWKSFSLFRFEII